MLTMKNMRIANKLLAAFGAIGLLLVAQAWFSIAQLGSVNSLMSLALRDRLPKVMTAQAVDTAISDFRVAEAQHILSLDPAGMAAAEASLNEQRTLIDRDVNDLDSKLRVANARALLATFRTEWDRYLTTDTALLALSRQNKNAEATALMRGKSQQNFDRVSKAAGQLATFEAQLVASSSDEGDVVYSRAKLLLMLAVAGMFACLGVVLVLLVKQVAKPVSSMTHALTDLAKGKMDVVVPVDDRTDEVGDLATAMKRLRDQLAAAERAKAEQTALIVDSVGDALSKLAEGDLMARVDADLTGPFAKLKNDFNGAAASLQETLAQVSDAAGSINNGAADIRQASDDLSQRTEQQAASLEETAAAMDEITSTVRTTAERATSANAAVKRAREDAEHSGHVVRDAVEAMGGIERTSNEISDIISVIDGIAFQTNLLALNAGVEAARAGDAGKGFAVVASEVRALAQRSAEAAKDVKTRITASSEQVRIGVELVGETGKALARIGEGIEAVNGLVAEIAASAEQQATGLQQINTAVSEMDGVTQQNAAMVEEATAAARSLASEVEGMSRQIARFRTSNAPGIASIASPVHQLQERAATVGRRISRAARHASGNAAVALEDEAWSQF
jgi:methyl-accepting chemotaxis protein